MSDLEIVSGPRLETRTAVATLGIRDTAPFRSMLSHRDRLLAELIDPRTEVRKTKWIVELAFKTREH